jgi:glycosyltransferase involved in cell wall biosynthesis
MRRKLVLLTELISPYRIPVFNALASRDDVNLHVMFLSETDPSQRQWLIYKDEIRFSHEVLPSWQRRIGGYHLLWNRGVSSSLGKISPDVIVCGGYSYPAFWQAAAWARRRKIPLVLWSESTKRDRRRQHKWVERAKRKFISTCRAYIVPGKASREYLETLGVGDKPIFTAPNAVDIERFATLAEAARAHADEIRGVEGLPDRYFLYAGRITREKGVFDLLEAYARLSQERRSRVGLVFVGDGAARSRLMKRAKELDGSRVIFPGFVQRDNLAKYYALADALVLPTYSDPWGLVVNEAMASGLPIVVSKAAGCAEDLVRHGWNGFVVRPREVGRLAEALGSLADDRELVRLMSQRSVERIQNFSPQICAAGLAMAAKVGV